MVSDPRVALDELWWSNTGAVGNLGKSALRVDSQESRAYVGWDQRQRRPTIGPIWWLSDVVGLRSAGPTLRIDKWKDVPAWAVTCTLGCKFRRKKG